MVGNCLRNVAALDSSQSEDEADADAPEITSAALFDM
jgi:hypothetical protein